MFLLIGWTPLINAAENGHLGIVEFLVTHGADVNIKGRKWGKFLNPLFYWVEIFFLTFKKKILSI